MLRSGEIIQCNSRKRLSKLDAAVAAALTPKKKRGRPAQDLPALRPEDVVRPVLKRGRPAAPTTEIPWSSFSPSSSRTIVVKEIKRGRPPAPPVVQQQQQHPLPMVVVPIVKRGRPPNKEKDKSILTTTAMVPYSNTMTMATTSMEPYSNSMTMSNTNHHST